MTLGVKRSFKLEWFSIRQEIIRSCELISENFLKIFLLINSSKVAEYFGKKIFKIGQVLIELRLI